MDTDIPLGLQFKSYELNSAINYYLLNPYQYAITKFDYSDPVVVPGAIKEEIKPRQIHTPDPNGLIYKGVDFETLLPAYTACKKSENDFPAQSYHRFLANEGYFNPNESIDNSDLWYYGATRNGNITGATLNVQEVNHIIFPEVQRGGLNSTNLVKYSWENSSKFTDKTSWEAQNEIPVDNNTNCQFFNYNNTYSLPAKEYPTYSFGIVNNHNTTPFNKVYSFDSDYTRSIGISSPTSGSMPFAS